MSHNICNIIYIYIIKHIVNTILKRQYKVAQTSKTDYLRMNPTTQQLCDSAQVT